MRDIIAERPSATVQEVLEEFLDTSCDEEEELPEATMRGSAVLKFMGLDVAWAHEG